MDSHTKPTPFNVGDHIRYVAAQRLVLPAGGACDPNPTLLGE